MADIFIKIICISILLFISNFCHFVQTLEQTQQSENEGSGNHIIVKDKNWEQILEGEWMLKFYAPWCPACRAMEETWHKFADWAAKNELTQLKVGSIDVTAQVALNGRFMITKLPTIYHVINGEFRQYTTNRELEDFIAFIGNEEWNDVSPVSSWTSPTSFLMSSMSKLFTLSMELKTYHNHLSTEHGFPQWLSMLLFGLLIILIGLLLGVVFVLASDYIWGAPQYYDDNVILTDKKDDDVITADDVSNDIVNENEELEKKDSENEGGCTSEEKSESSETALRQRKVNE